MSVSVVGACPHHSQLCRHGPEIDKQAAVQNLSIARRDEPVRKPPAFLRTPNHYLRAAAGAASPPTLRVGSRAAARAPTRQDIRNRAPDPCNSPTRGTSCASSRPFSTSNVGAVVAVTTSVANALARGVMEVGRTAGPSRLFIAGDVDLCCACRQSHRHIDHASYRHSAADLPFPALRAARNVEVMGHPRRVGRVGSGDCPADDYRCMAPARGELPRQVVILHSEQRATSLHLARRHHCHSRMGRASPPSVRQKADCQQLSSPRMARRSSWAPILPRSTMALYRTLPPKRTSEPLKSSSGRGD